VHNFATARGKDSASLFEEENGTKATKTVERVHDIPRPVSQLIDRSPNWSCETSDGHICEYPPWNDINT
jgi:hypothetical protein